MLSGCRLRAVDFGSICALMTWCTERWWLTLSSVVRLYFFGFKSQSSNAPLRYSVMSVRITLADQPTVSTLRCSDARSIKDCIFVAVLQPTSFIILEEISLALVPEPYPLLSSRGVIIVLVIEHLQLWLVGGGSHHLSTSVDFLEAPE